MINYRTQSRFREINRFSITGRNVSYFVLEVDMADRREYMKEYNKQYSINNKEKLIKYKNEWYLKNKEKTSEQKKIYYRNHKKRMIEYHKEYCKNNSEKMKKYHREYMKKYRDNYKEKLNKKRNEWIKKKNKINLKFNLNNRISSAVRHSLKGNKNGRSWEKLVGYTLKDLIKRLKKTMPRGYTWQDYLEGRLHIDHKIPISAHNYTKSEHTDFKRCWALSNLRLLSVRENLIKNSKLSKPFQPALQI